MENQIQKMIANKAEQKRNSVMVFDNDLKILFVDNNKDEIEEMENTLGKSFINCSLKIVNDGLEASKYLEKDVCCGDAPVPNLIVLNLKLPGLSGSELIKLIKCNEKLMNIPVMVIGTRNSKSYKFNGGIKKPIGVVRKSFNWEELPDFLKLLNESHIN